MGKKVSQAERVAAMLDEEKVRAYITEHTLHPAVLLGGTRTETEERIQYRCAHCRHEWEVVYREPYARNSKTVLCPKCRDRMYPGVKIPTNTDMKPCSFLLYDGFMVRNFRYLVYVDAAMLDDTEGLIIAEYEPTVEYRYSDIPESFEVKLQLNQYGFVSPSHKLLYNDSGAKSARYLRNAFSGWNTSFAVSRDAERLRPSLPWMAERPSFDGGLWLSYFDAYWAKRATSPQKSLSERHAEQILDKFKIPELPSLSITRPQIAARDIAVDILTGKHHMEYCCMACGTRFSSDTAYNRSNVVCPKCELSTGMGGAAKLAVAYTSEDVGVLTMLDETTLLIRAGTLFCQYDEQFVPCYRYQEMYRTIIELNPGTDPRIHFLVNEGTGDNAVWVKKKSYTAPKFRYSVKQLEYIGELDALKYTGLREFIDYKLHKAAHSYSVLLPDIIHYIRFQSMYPVVEQLCKRGFCATLEDEIAHRVHHQKQLCMDLSQKKVTEALGLPERLIRIYLKESDYHSRLVTFQKLYRLDPDVREEDIAWLELHGVGANEVGDVLQESQMSIMRLCEYLEHVRINQCFEPKNAIVDWRDYLKAAKTIEVDLTDNKARYPSSLKREHDRAVAKQKLVLDAKKDEFFQKEVERYSGLYSYQTDAYMIIPPKDMKDLFEEGRKLNHCVGSYSDRIVEGKTCIMFLRKKEEPDKPYFTIEINQSNSYVVQLRANSNRCINHSTEKELVKFLREWSKKKKVSLNGAA